MVEISSNMQYVAKFVELRKKVTNLIEASVDVRDMIDDDMSSNGISEKMLDTIIFYSIRKIYVQLSNNRVKINDSLSNEMVDRLIYDDMDENGNLIIDKIYDQENAQIFELVGEPVVSESGDEIIRILSSAKNKTRKILDFIKKNRHDI